MRTDVRSEYKIRRLSAKRTIHVTRHSAVTKVNKQTCHSALNAIRRAAEHKNVKYTLNILALWATMPEIK